MTLTDDVVERVARAIAPVLVEFGPDYTARVARAALEAARYGELVGLLSEADSVAWPEVAIMLTHERPRSVVAKERFLAWRDKARALLSTIGAA